MPVIPDRQFLRSTTVKLNLTDLSRHLNQPVFFAKLRYYSGFSGATTRADSTA